MPAQKRLLAELDRRGVFVARIDSQITIEFSSEHGHDEFVLASQIQGDKEIAFSGTTIAFPDVDLFCDGSVRSLSWRHVDDSEFISPQIAARLLTIPGLITASIEDMHGADEAVTSLSEATTIQELSLRYCDLTDSGIPFIARLKSLRKLTLDGTSVRHGHLSMKSLLHLQSVSVEKTNVTDSFLSNLPPECIALLALGNSAISDSSVPTILRMSNLKTLSIIATKIKPRGVASIVAELRLDTLEISESQLGKEAIDSLNSLPPKRLRIGVSQPMSRISFRAVQAKIPRVSAMWFLE